MLFSNITVIDENLEVGYNKYVLVAEDKIAYVGDEKPLENYKREYDGKGKLLLSGFYNGHGHSPMTLMRGYGENMVLQDWLTKKIFPFEDKLDGEAVYWATMLAMAESLRFGIVSTSDMYFFCEDIVRAVMDSGAKGNIARAVTNPFGHRIEELVCFEEMKKLYTGYHNSAQGRIKIDMSLHAEYTSNREAAEELAEYAKSIKDTVMHVHVSETLSEHESCVSKYGMTPAAYLESTGIFDVPALAAHCVYSNEDDLEIFKEKGVTVATNPVSNMKLASGICDVRKVIDKGINLAIGTDSVASNNSLNMIEEMKFMALGCKAKTGDPTAVRPVDALRAATIGGAKAQRRNDCGVLKAGNKADLIVIDISEVNMHPVHNLINNLVYSGSGKDVVLTMVDGKILYENGVYSTIDIERVIFEVQKSTDKILERL